jgi:hypothetical protein
MKRTYSPDMKAAATKHLAEQDYSSHLLRYMALRVMEEFWDNNDDGMVVITQARMKEIAGVSVPVVRKFTNEASASGLWQIRVGIGLFSTTYKPLFLDEVHASARKGN